MIESWCLSFSSLVHYMVRRKASLSSIPSHSLLLSCLSSPRILSVPTTQSEWREREKRWKGRKKGLHSYLLLSIPCHIIPAPKRWKWHEGMERRGKEWPSLSPVSVRSFLSLSFIWIIDGRERSEMESCLLSLPFSVPCHCYSFSLVTAACGQIPSQWLPMDQRSERRDNDLSPPSFVHSLICRHQIISQLREKEKVKSWRHHVPYRSLWSLLSTCQAKRRDGGRCK